MSSERRRLLELALDALENKKRSIDREIDDISKELRGIRGRRTAVVAPRAKAATASSKSRSRKRPTFSKEERQRRSARMKAYWEKWRKEKARAK